MEIKVVAVLILHIAICHSATQTQTKCEIDTCLRNLHTRNPCSDWMLRCLRRQHQSCGTSVTDISGTVLAISETRSCVWEAGKALEFITRSSNVHSRAHAHKRQRRSGQDPGGFNLDSLMSSMVDMTRNRISTANRLMKTMLNSTTTSNDGNMNALLLAGMDDGPLDDLFDDGPFDDLLDDDDGLGMAMLPGLLADNEKTAPLAPKIRIDAGGAAMQQGQLNGAGSQTSNIPFTWLAVICAKMLYLKMAS